MATASLGFYSVRRTALIKIGLLMITKQNINLEWPKYLERWRSTVAWRHQLGPCLQSKGRTWARSCRSTCRWNTHPKERRPYQIQWQLDTYAKESTWIWLIFFFNNITQRQIKKNKYVSVSSVKPIFREGHSAIGQGGGLIDCQCQQTTQIDRMTQFEVEKGANKCMQWVHWGSTSANSWKRRMHEPSDILTNYSMKAMRKLHQLGL